MGWDRRRRMRRLGTLGAAAVATLALAGPAGAAQTINVGTTADGADPSPGNTTCDLSPCTLRAAIQTANQDPGSTVVLPPNLSAYQLTIPGGNEDAGATGDLDVSASTTITGAGAASAVIDGGDLDRVLDVRAGTVSISGVTIRNGKAAKTPTGPMFGEPGGGLRTVNASVVTVTDSTITANEIQTAGHGGGAAAVDTSQLTLQRVQVTNNLAVDAPGGAGGGVAEESPGVVVKIVDSTVSGNQAQFAAGVYEDGTGRVEITRSSISNNSTVPYATLQLQSGGGVVEGAGTVVITDSAITGNVSAYGAGIVEEGGTLTITNSVVANNQARAVLPPDPPGQNAPHSNGVGGGLVEYGGTITITGTTFSGNTADLNGGAMVFQGRNGGPVNITNTTIAFNTAGVGGAAIRMDERNDATFTNVTIDRNTAARGRAVNICDGGPALPAGYCVSPKLTFRNSIVAGGCSKTVGSIVSAGHNLDDGTTCGFAGPGDVTGQDPKLNTLAANGGPTQTESLQDGSPAIDTAANCPVTDQRGLGRPFGPACDIGAFEGGVPLVVAPPPGNNPPKEVPAADLASARTPTCLSIPGVVRDQKANAPGGGRVTLQTRQIDDPANPLRTSVKLSGKGTIRSVTFKVNGRTVKAATASAAAGSTKALPVAVTFLRLGSKAKRNKVTATVVLGNGKRVTLTQFMIVLKCSAPATKCKRLADTKTMSCTSKTPLGGRRVRVTASRTTTEVAKGSATVKKGKYTTTLRSTVPLAPGTYAYKHVVTTSKPRQRYFMIRRVTVT